ncbi:sensor histidine kinase [Pontibacter locisalis]|uniref:Sensor histidine kinase n=1 Tax=Pontibacter locisalis TaxID=1719035 RepID=A0ABW5INE7_9BACT
MDELFSKYYNKKTRVLWHVAFWLTYLLYHVLVIVSVEDGNYLEVFVSRSLNLPVKIIATYFVLYVLIPRFFMKKKVLAFSVFFFVTLLAAGFFQHLYYHFITYPVLYPERVYSLGFPVIEIFKNVLTTYPVVSLAAFIKIGKHWLEKERVSQRLEREKVEAELKFLKAQLHPHFLFNTLNNLYALTLKKSDKASEVVLKLSSLLDYILYEGNAHTVPLKKELDLVATYVHLEKIRYGEKLRVNYCVRGGVGGKVVPPLLILPFVENSFKHGVSQQTKEMWVNIDVEVKANLMLLKVENSKFNNGSALNRQGSRGGIGLQNVKRRLDLLYGKNHELTVSNEEDTFSVLLAISVDEPLKMSNSKA